jgi:hypothetical protein
MLKKNKIIFIALFIFIGIIVMQFKFTQIIGSNINFSLFDFYGPIVGGFMGSVFGLITVLAMQIINWAWHGFAVDAGTLIRFLPMLLAVIYFSKKTKWILIAPAFAMIAFWIHPEGRNAWYYALYWLIPIIMYFWHDKFILARALGTTFTAHCVGSILFLYVFNLKSAVWISLIPIVWKERGLMAVGITLTFVAFNYLLSLVDKKIELHNHIKLHPKYLVK